MNKRLTIIGAIVLVLLVMVSASAYASGMILGNSQSDNAQPIFYRLAPEDESKLTQIVLSDSRIQELIKGKDYAFNVRGHSIRGQDWGLQVGGVFKDNVGAEGLNKWLAEGRKDKSVIEKYVGVLYVGYNDVYDIAIDAENARVTELSAPQVRHEPRIPELTREDREKAITITLDDPRVQELLAGKDYVVAPESVVIWHSSKDHNKIGAGLEIWLDQTYPIEYNWPWPEYDEAKYPSFPYYQVQTVRQTYEAKALVVLVDLDQGEVAGIMPRPFGPGTQDLYKPNT